MNYGEIKLIVMLTLRVESSELVDFDAFWAQAQEEETQMTKFEAMNVYNIICQEIG